MFLQITWVSPEMGLPPIPWGLRPPPTLCSPDTDAGSLRGTSTRHLPQTCLHHQGIAKLPPAHPRLEAAGCRGSPRPLSCRPFTRARSFTCVCPGVREDADGEPQRGTKPTSGLHCSPTLVPLAYSSRFGSQYFRKLEAPSFSPPRVMRGESRW